MIKKTLERIRQLQQQPEDVRLRAAISITIVVGLIIVFIVLAVLLPLQLYLT